MKKYILIQNDGEIETNSFELIGASTKRNETGKIGFFGSGLKYSIAYMMRNNIDFKVFSGAQELKFTTMPEVLKDQSFDRICINGKPTSYTVTMGPTWKEDWFVLREIYCNAIDEGSCTMVKSTEEIHHSEGKTRIFIELTPSLTKVIENWDAYFSDERQPLFEADNVYTCYLGSEDVSAMLSQPIKVYKKTEGVIYRKGIRVHKDKYLMFDYGCQSVNINEDRTARNSSGLSYGIAHLVSMLEDEEYVKMVLRTAQDDDTTTEYAALNHAEDKWSNKWVQFSKDNLLVVKEISGKYSEEIGNSRRESFLIPSMFARKLKKNVPDAIVLGMGKSIGDKFAEEVELTPKMNYLLKEVVASLKEMKYEIPYEISVVNFEDEDTLGAANIKDKKIHIAAKTFDLGRREIALVLMEETEHIVSKKEDETRAFQGHLISEWLKTMENSNGLFL